MSVFDTKVTYADNYTGKNSKTITLGEALATINNSATNKAAYKQGLPVIVYGCTVGESLKDIKTFSGLVALDVDIKPERGENTQLRRTDAKDKAIEAALSLPNTVAVHDSYSGGLRIIQAFEGINSRAAFKAAFNVARMDVEQSLGVVVDKSCSNANRTNFIAAELLKIKPDAFAPKQCPEVFEMTRADIDASVFADSDAYRTQQVLDLLARTDVDNYAGRDDCIFNVAVQIKEIGIPREEALALMHQELFDKIDWTDDLPPSLIDFKVNYVYDDDKYRLGATSLDVLFAGIDVEEEKEIPPHEFGFAALADKEAIILEGYNPEDDFYVIPRMALKGEITTVFAAANSGKTLIALAELCKNAEAIKKENLTVVYINLDDSLKGHVQKKSLLAQYGIKAVSAGAILKISHVVEGIKRYTPELAKNTVLIIDTNKKVVNQSDKNEMRAAHEVFREFVLNGGTIIGLAHVNKNVGADGRFVYEGMSDNVSDVDRTLILKSKPVRDDSGFTEVVFEVDKVRGGVQNSGELLTYTYGGTGVEYESKFHSVQFLDRDDAKSFEEATRMQSKLSECRDWLIAAEKQILENPESSRRRIAEAMQQVRYASLSTLEKVVDDFVGKRWELVECKIGKQKFAYSLIEERELISE